jgi:hypothetical protein
MCRRRLPEFLCLHVKPTGAILLSVVFVTCFQSWFCVLFFCPKSRFAELLLTVFFRLCIWLRG